MLKKGKSIKHYIYLSWAIPAIFAFITVLIVFCLFSYLDYQHSVKNIKNGLDKKSSIISRRLSAELLLGKAGAVEAVSKDLKSEYNLLSINVISDQPNCILIRSKKCSIKAGNVLTFYKKIEHVPGKPFLELKVIAPSLFSNLNIMLLVWSMLPILFVLGLALLIQRYYLRKYILKPIESLVDTAILEKTPSQKWPNEIQEISTKLSRSFEDRDKAVFGQIVSGVIHDIKTHLHSVLSATQLVGEVERDNEKRISRLELLHKTCKINLIKMKNIVDLTLDGDREVSVHKQNIPVSESIKNSILVTKEIAKNRNVAVSFQDENNNSIRHDPIQAERVFTNLIKNAIEAFDLNDDDVSRLVKVSISNDEITIEDNGPGIKNNKKLFKPLKSSKSHGSGLGLFVSKKIIEAHGGSIKYSNSQSLGGAKFTVSFDDEQRGIL